MCPLVAYLFWFKTNGQSCVISATPKVPVSQAEWHCAFVHQLASAGQSSQQAGTPQLLLSLRSYAAAHHKEISIHENRGWFSKTTPDLCRYDQNAFHINVLDRISLFIQWGLFWTKLNHRFPQRGENSWFSSLLGLCLYYFFPSRTVLIFPLKYYNI